MENFLKRAHTCQKNRDDHLISCSMFNGIISIKNICKNADLFYLFPELLQNQIDYLLLEYPVSYVYIYKIDFSKCLVCELLDLGIVGIFGPQEKVVAEYVQSICDTIEVPRISVRQNLDQSFQQRGLNLNLYPHVNSLSRVSN